MSVVSVLEGCIMLNEHNTVFARSGPLYAKACCFPRHTRVVDANGISIASAVFAGTLSDRPTDRPTDHATRSVKIGEAHNGKAKFCYCLRLQQVIIGAVVSTDRINFSKEQL